MGFIRKDNNGNGGEGGNVTIVNNLNSSSSTSALSANQGKVLNEKIEAIDVPTKTSELENDNGFITINEVNSDLFNESIRSSNLYNIDAIKSYSSCLKQNNIIVTSSIPSNGLFFIDCDINNVGSGTLNLKAGTYFFRVKAKSTGSNYFNQFRICSNDGNYVRMTRIEGTIGLDDFNELIYVFTIDIDYSNIGFLIQGGSTASIYELKDFMLSTTPIEYEPYNIELSNINTINNYNLQNQINAENNLCSINWFGNSMVYLATSGKCGTAQTNTKEAIRQSAHCGYDGVELDIRLTKDNQIVCYHNQCTDDLLNTTGGLNIYEYTLEELKAYKYKSDWISNCYDYDLTIMSLDEAVQICREYGLRLHLDIKTDEYEKTNYMVYIDSILSVLTKYNYQNKTVFITSDFDIINYIRSKNSNAIISYKIYISNNGTQLTTVENDLYYLTKIGGKVIAQCEDTTLYTVPSSILTDDRIKKYHSYGFPVKGFDFEHLEDEIIDKVKRERIIYTTKINSTDHGTTWIELNNILNLTISNYNSGSGLLLKIGKLDHLLMMSCNPLILLDTGVDKQLKLSATYSSSDKGIVITGTYGDNNFIGNLGSNYQNVTIRLIF